MPPEMPWDGPPQKSAGPVFEQVDQDRYRLIVPDSEITLDVDRVHRGRDGQLIGELMAICQLRGTDAEVDDGVLNISNLNMSSESALQKRARYLATRARTASRDVDWLGLLETLSQRVLQAERNGKPAISLRDLPRPDKDEVLEVYGIPLLRRHPIIWFGDGGSAKSYLALFCAGKLSQNGFRVGLFDWELAGEDHRERLERLFGESMPDVKYVKCERPLVVEKERLRRIAKEEELDFAIFDSVAFACHDAPESAEVAASYFRAVRQIGVGSLHVAHINKSDASDQKPFGSVFWHNGARATWFIKLAEATPDGQTIQLGLFNRKANTSARRSAVGLEIEFNDDKTIFQRVDLANVPDLAAKLSIRQRMIQVLRNGAMSRDALAEQLSAKPESIRRIAKRDTRNFVVLDGGFIGLQESNL